MSPRATVAFGARLAGSYRVTAPRSGLTTQTSLSSAARPQATCDLIWASTAPVTGSTLDSVPPFTCASDTHTAPAPNVMSQCAGTSIRAPISTFWDGSIQSRYSPWPSIQIAASLAASKPGRTLVRIAAMTPGGTVAAGAGVREGNGVAVGTGALGEAPSGALAGVEVAPPPTRPQPRTVAVSPAARRMAIVRWAVSIGVSGLQRAE